ncbi:phosphofructokinase [Paenibacillus darwinianus]|uniref:Tagatose-6-phosphate kinase n=1 Tax=Paenibacillus darwinianus TaxID=1380763 RepID=A0A9W5W811_9BACL|nr:1-phosphofructokinase [Paenibacillus darwinianus]EXX87914.1 phosphofructokinase [Paenibacillus darwinianus]EXX90502.1 phosphofructokinase [Paenibacillus darwinianus]EXX90545.1 phosphofructokinase [Paenibacillus darwinianus]
MTNAAAPVITVTLNPALDKTVTIDRFEYGGLNRIQEMRTDAGGKGINVAKVLKRFDTDVLACGILAGHQGGVITEKLATLGIRSGFVQTAGETRTNLKVVDRSTQLTTELNEKGFTVDAELLARFCDRFREEARSASAVVLAGSLPQGAPPDFYRTLIAIANELGVRTVLDADGEAFRLGIEAVPYAIKPNIHELEALLGRTLDDDEAIVRAAGDLIAKGIKLVAVSMGGKGSLVVSADEAYRAHPVPITPLSTVGAGDSMVAAIVYCVLHGKSLEETTRWSSAAGSVTASKPGTEVCGLDEVKTMLHAVTVTEPTYNRL